MNERVPPDVDLVWDEFHRTVNMTSDELRNWLLTDASGEEAFPADPDLHISGLGREVVKLLGKRKVDLNQADAETMREVVDYVADRLDERPAAGAADEDWRRSLMNVGHDPLKPA